MGRLKQFYCIDYRNMHTAIHGLLLFETRDLGYKILEYAESHIHKLERKVATGEIEKEIGDTLYNDIIYTILKECCGTVDEIDFRKIKERTIEKSTGNKLERYYSEKYQDKYKLIILNICSIDLYL